MKSKFRTPVASALLIAGLAMPIGAYAQSSPTPPPAPPAAAAPAPATSPAVDTPVAKRIAQLHAALHITPDEEPLWQHFADTMRDNARTMDQDYKDRATKFEGLSALDNMRSYAQIAQEHAQDVQHLVAAFEPLYTAMPDAQKKVADEVFRNKTASHTEQH